MRILLDAHALLWFINADEHLSRGARAAVENDRNSIVVSLATIWEIASKVGLGKLRLRLKLEGELEEFLIENGFILLSIEYVHVARVARLPRHHGGPFDRLLASQSLIENMPVVSHDLAFDAYGVKRIW
ncbi:MAG: type II toxin-antitoxin system VapC family toxin [Verrucomicrobia bacterium]|nr:type II toxin-antitoxin system VapC family toxin [Verrucomicrobiota bacterium]